MQGGTILDLKSPVYLIATYIRTPQSGIPVKASDSVHLTPRRDYILKSVSASESGDRRMIVSVRRAVAKRSHSCEDSGSSAVLHSSTAHAYVDLLVACRWEYKDRVIVPEYRNTGNTCICVDVVEGCQ